MQRDWCPSGVLDSSTLLKSTACDNPDKTPRGFIDINVFCCEACAVAANMDKSAVQLAAQLTSSIKSSKSRYSIRYIASRENKCHWPRSRVCSPFEWASPFLTQEILSNYDAASLAPFMNNHYSIRTISLPVDQFLNLLVSLSYTDHLTHSESIIRNLLILPSLSKDVSFEDLHPYLKSYIHLFSNIRFFSLSGVRVESEGIVSFCSSLKYLTNISIDKTPLRDHACAFFSLLKDSLIEYLSLEGDDLGGTHEEVDDNEVLSSLSEFLKYNKFLRSLNLSHNNFTSEEIEALMTALGESDTILSPDSIPSEERDNVKSVSKDQLLPLSYFSAKSSDPKAGIDSRGSTSEEEEDEESIFTQHDDQSDKEENEEEEEAKTTSPNSEEQEENAEENEDENSEHSNDSSRAEYHGKGTRQYHFKVNCTYLKRKFLEEQRLLAEEEESAREQIIIAYANPLENFLNELAAIHTLLKAEKQRKIKEYCQARSGWSRLKCLNLRGNSFGDRGVRAIGLILRHEILLTTEELDRIEEHLKENFFTIVQELEEKRKLTLNDECCERSSLMKALTQLKSMQLPPPSAEKRYKQADDFNDDEEDEEQGLPEVIMSNMDDTVSNEAKHSTEVLVNRIMEDFDWDMEAVNVAIPILPRKAGMRSLKFLDISSCGITGNGLKLIASSLEHNKTLITLILRNNPIDKLTETPSQLDADMNGLNAAPTKVSDHFPQTNFSIFASMLQNNQTLRSIDLSYCQLRAESIISLSSGLCKNKVLCALNLEGNSQAFSRGTGRLESSLLTLLSAIDEAVSIEFLNLSNNDLTESLWEEELHALGNIIVKLTVLHLFNVGLNGDHIAKLATSVAGRSSSLRVLSLGRNHLITEDSSHIGSLLKLCKSLEELSLDENPKLNSAGLLTLLSSLQSSTLRWLSCNGTAVTLASAIPPFVARHLHYLSLSDIEITGADELATWARLLEQHGGSIRFLSLWSRHLDMQLNLNTLKELIRAMPSLLYADFGILLRFDSETDEFGALGETERILTSRRANLMSTSSS